MMEFLHSAAELFAVNEIALALGAACNSPDPHESHWADPYYFLVAFSQPSLKRYRKSLQLSWSWVGVWDCVGPHAAEENVSFTYQNVPHFVWMKYLTSQTPLPPW